MLLPSKKSCVIQNTVIELPQTPYKWRDWDCFALADWLRSQSRLHPLPNLDWLYRNYTEQTLPPAAVSNILRHYARKRARGLVDMDLLALRFGANPEGLGTVVSGGVVFMSFERGAVWMPLGDMQSRISGVWTY